MVASAVAFSDLYFSAFDATTFAASFTENFTAAMASAARVASSNIQITSIQAGSVQVMSTTFFSSDTSNHDMFIAQLSNSTASIFPGSAWTELVYIDDYEELPSPVDEAPPLLTLHGSEYVQLVQRDVYTDAGAVAYDDVDGFGVEVVVTGLDAVATCCVTTQPFRIIYDAVDRAGNRAASVERLVGVEAACPPPSYLCEDISGVVCASCSESDDGNTACVCLDTAIISGGAEDGAVVPEYVPLIDTEPPSLVLLGEGTLAVSSSGTVIMLHEVEVGQTFVIPGIEAYDDVDGNLTAAVSSFGAGAIDTSMATPEDAPYVVTYSVSDRAGNSASEVRRRVSVMDPCAGAGADGRDEAVCGRDAAGVAECSVGGLCLSLTVEPEEEAAEPNPPVLELLGPAEVEAPPGQPYLRCPEERPLDLVCDQGATANDAVDGVLTKYILACSLDGTSNRFDKKGVTGCLSSQAPPGKYLIEFSVTNSAGLTAYTSRTVTLAPSCATGERLCEDGVTCSIDGVCMSSLIGNAAPEAVETSPPFIALRTFAAVPSAYVEVKQFAVYESCSAEAAEDPSVLCDPGVEAQTIEGADLSSAVLVCPEESCLSTGCPGHELVHKGIQACLNTSAEVGTVFTVQMLVFDHATPPQSAAVYRTITIVDSCADGQFLCSDRTCSDVECSVRDSLLAEEADTTPPVITFRNGSAVAIHYGDAAAAASLAPCTFNASESWDDGSSSCYAVAVDAASGDVSSSLAVRQDSGCSACSTRSCILESVHQCLPGTYGFLYSATDPEGNYARERLMVSVVEQGEVRAEILISASTSNVVEAQAQAETYQNKSTAENAALRQVRLYRALAEWPGRIGDHQS
eukprot:gene1525-biopygen1385